MAIAALSRAWLCVRASWFCAIAVRFFRSLRRCRPALNLPAASVTIMPVAGLASPPRKLARPPALAPAPSSASP